ncbi:galactonate dehydratase [Marinovum sp. 2_MG-2023]|uniref:galactonate dehydratase n=1 Tax=unclassified Marinovum TaxID=2647166 RepID=UPI0026E38369|nr:MULTISPECIES: galactonate dehydratase [unclassified Marinovum]MDO6732686.1 galactonate dehydratase [Marinovum sp. 2_MG-2023]MDO6781959.1 galactonate dehydratase [Marinovum sp. 1_MG-2023]
MKITALKTYAVPPRWVFLKIETDEGVCGWGEPVLEGHAQTLKAKVKELETFVIGRDPARIEDIWQLIYRNGCYRGGPVLMSAISGIDMALWDIKGKVCGQPVHSLLGGPVRDRIRSYRWIGGDRVENLVEGAQEMRAEGYDAVKFNVCTELQIVDTYAKVDKIVETLSEVRAAVGSTMDLAFDFHGRVHYPMARVLLKEIEHLRPIFVEDAVVSTQVDAMAQLAQLTSVRLCTGERMHSRYDFRPVFESLAASVINPDTAHVGGISEMVRIGHMAEAYDVALAPHCPLGPIALAACLQVDAVCYNAFIQEQSLGMHYNSGGDLNDYLTPETRFSVEDGFLPIPQGDGLGIEVDEAVVIERSKQEHDWRAPIWRHADGSISEW